METTHTLELNDEEYRHYIELINTNIGLKKQVLELNRELADMKSMRWKLMAAAGALAALLLLFIALWAFR
ncbi:MAG: hypothetical protein LBG83_05110 [Oscillospiraceae bacterium]|nr:hypothetical protein [Oscillospiraceae bacterium]